MPTTKRALNVRPQLKEMADGILITLSLSELVDTIRWITFGPSADAAIASKRRTIMAKSAKPAAKSKRAGASKPKKAQSYKAGASPKLTNRPGNSPHISAGMKRYWKQRKLKAKLR